MDKCDNTFICNEINAFLYWSVKDEHDRRLKLLFADNYIRILQNFIARSIFEEKSKLAPFYYLTT